MRKIIKISLFIIISIIPLNLLYSQSFTVTSDTIFVKGSKYFLNIDRTSGMIAVQNQDRVTYTSFPLFAYPVPFAKSKVDLKYTWKIEPPAIEVTIKNHSETQTILKAILKFHADDFEIGFGIYPKIASLDYDVNIVNGSWPWGLGIDTSFSRHTISLAGKKYHKGLGAHAYSNVKLTFKKPAGFKEFKSIVGIDDAVGKPASVQFLVMVDGKKSADSGTMKAGMSAKSLVANCENAKTIELVVTDAGDGEGADQADWADARLISDQGKEIYISDLITNFQKGLRIFTKDDRSFDTSKWIKMFTPEPDNYYSNSSVMVGIRQDVDGQRYFAPAPLNLSFQTPAGWFSLGLCQLPDAVNFQFQDGYVSIDYPWDKMELPENLLYWTTPICFTFNKTEWDGIKDYRNYLMKNGYASDVPIEEKQIPDWWMYPLICTWGEQTLDNAAQDKPRFTSNWVKEYVSNLEKKLEIKKYTLIIDDKWQQKYGDPYPDSTRFRDLRELVDWVHRKGHKVLLWWRCWYGEEGSLPDRMGILDGDYIDATHPRFEEYVKQSVKMIFGDDAGELNADGLKVDYIFDVRNPPVANYANPSLGIGFREVYRYADILYREAKKIKKDCLITFSGPDPHFSLIQDISRLNDAGRDSLQRQYRAHVNALSAPNLLIDGDGAAMFESLANYHHITSSVFSIPSLYYLTNFEDGHITDEMQKMIGKIFRLAALKKPGRAVFRNFGNWQFVREKKVIAESFLNGTAIIVFKDMSCAFLLTTKQQDIYVSLKDAFPVKVQTEQGNDVQFKILSSNEMMIPNAPKGEIYIITFNKKED